MKRIRDVAGASALLTAAVAIVLSGCSVMSPAITAEPYAASDGAGLDLPGSSVVLRNFLVVGAEKDARAVVVGAVVNDGPSEAKVSLQADLGETTQPTATIVTVGPNSSVLVGPDERFQMEVPQLPVVPGATIKLSASTTTGGKAELDVPVLRPESEYSGFTPAPTTAEPTPTETKKPKASSSGAEETDEPTETPTD